MNTITLQTALIVEDSHLFRRCLGEVLRTLFPSLRVVELADGRDVLAQVAALKPDIVFMDIKLPDANGLNLTRKIKHLNTETPVAIVTSYHQPEYREAALDAGASYFFRKDELNEHLIEHLVRSALPA